MIPFALETWALSIYLEHAVAIREADALTIDNNFIAECGNCVELLTCGQACKVANNLMGAGYCGHSIYAENYGGLLISANNVFPRGRSSIHLVNYSLQTLRLWRELLGLVTRFPFMRPPYSLLGYHNY